MSVKLSRYIFRRIGGRIVPIRAGAKVVDLVKGVSKTAQKKIKLFLSNREATLSKSGKIKKYVSHSGTEFMEAFMRKSGAVRFSQNDRETVFSYTKKLTEGQRRKLMDFAGQSDEIVAGVHGKYTKGADYIKIGENDRSFSSIREFLSHPMSRKGIDTPKTLSQIKSQRKLGEKAILKFGKTYDPKEAGYILPTGTALDFSGRSQGAGIEAFGKRYMDHREVSDIVKLPFTKNPSIKETKMILRQAQLDRKQSARKLHRITTLKQDISRIGHSKNLSSVKKDMLKTLNDLIKQKRMRKK